MDGGQRLALRAQLLTGLELVVAGVVMCVGATLQGSVGFGMGLVGSPVLILIDPRFVPGPVLLSTLVLTTFLTWRERHSVDVRGVGWAVAGRVVGTLAAVSVLAVLPQDWTAIVCAGVVLLAVLMSVSGLRFRPVWSVLVVAGALSGLMGTIASIGGPPVAMVYQDAKAMRLRATLSSFFWIGTIMSLVALRAVGRFGAYELRLTLFLLPSMMLGYVLSRWTKGLVDRGRTRVAVLAVATISGVVVIVRQLA